MYFTFIICRQSPQEEQNTVFEMKLNITDSELVVVENASLWESNAVILKVIIIYLFICEGVPQGFFLGPLLEKIVRFN